MQVKTRSVVLIFFVLLTQKIWAQDPQFSQYYAASTYLNPAFAGASTGIRAGLNHRMQWPKLGATFTTSAFSVDYNWERFNSGLGLLIVTNQVSEAAISATDLNLQYAYNLQLSKDYYFRAGIQFGYGIRSLDFSKLVFTRQLSADGLIDAVSGENFNTDNFSYWGVSTGGVLYSEKLWLGASFHHMNRPVQSFFNNQDIRLPIKYSVHGGYKIVLYQKSTRPYGAKNSQFFDEEELSISPTFNYKAQGEFDQLDLGVYVQYSPVLLGVWYRGLPIKRFESGIVNQDALILLAAFTWKWISIWV